MAWDKAYRSSRHVLGKDFLSVALSGSRRYHRAAGFFSSSVFKCFQGTLKTFVNGGGRIQLVTSPLLQLADYRSLLKAISDRPSCRKQLPLESTLELFAINKASSSDLLASLFTHDIIDIKIALPNPLGERRLYHEKIGYFVDAESDVLAFTGSANESYSGMCNNFERIEVVNSWGEQEQRVGVRRIVDEFAALWTNHTNKLSVISIFDAISSDLIQPVGTEDEGRIDPLPQILTNIRLPPEILHTDPDKTLFGHQEEAIRAWGNAGGRGILKLATGAGKTITALTLAAHLNDRIGPGLCIVMIAPYIHLVDQWREVARPFGLRPIRCAEGSATWLRDLSTAVNAYNSKTREVLSVFTTVATALTPAFREIISKIRRPMLLIGDEVHNYGAASAAECLPVSAQFRLGLSATPERWMDDEGSNRIYDYFGPVVARYDLADAIRDGVLTPYRFHPVLIELEEDEAEEYALLSANLARCMGHDDSQPSEYAKALLIKRARLLASARNKLPALIRMLDGRRRHSHILVYCGDGQVEGEEDAKLTRQVDECVRLIGEELGMRCASYTASTPPERRAEITKEFSDGTIQVLVAIRCLDEGVDVPATRSAYILASSTNPKQFVQRRGRVLRRSPGKDYADIYDFIVIPPPGDLDRESAEYKYAKGIFRGQINRIREFADLADNGPVARSKIVDYIKKYNLLTLWEQ